MTSSWTQREAGDYARLLCAYVVNLPLLLYCGALIEIIGCPDLEPQTLNNVISAVGCQNSSVWVMFWILYPCRNLQH